MTAPYATREPPVDVPYRGAPFGAAFVRFWKKGFTFTGRASRSEYWMAYLATILPVMVLYLLATFVTTAPGFIILIAVLYGLATLIPGLAVVWRRLHDTNQSGAMYFLGLIPFVGGIILLVLLAQDSNPAGIRFDVQSGHSGLSPVAAPYGYNTATVSSAPLAPPSPEQAPTQAFAAGSPLPPPPPPPAFAAAIPPIPPPVISSPLPAFAPPSATALAHPVLNVTPSAVDEDLDLTRRAVPTAAVGWIVQLPDGRRIPAASALYFGRSPVARPEHPSALVVPIDDATKSMSKTHASLVVIGDALMVTDLHSTNGTTVAATGSSPVALAPGIAHRVTGDATVSFGDYSIAVQRNIP
ncbi:MAG TPA: DUF805 domain-containing protein [Microbacteriaceae bacterium]